MAKIVISIFQCGTSLEQGRVYPIIDASLDPEMERTERRGQRSISTFGMLEFGGNSIARRVFTLL